jgi:Ca2+-binding EF-hand superfamily protein
MGTAKSKTGTTLKTSELNEFHNMTLFSNEILIKLHEYYRHFSSIQTDDGIIDFDEFCLLIKRNDRNLTKRIFNAIDVNLDGSINFREFIKFISVFINGTMDEQITLSYKIFSNPQTKLIQVETMCNLIKDVITAEDSISKFLTENEIQTIVKETFKKIGGDEEQPIDFERFRDMLKKYPEILAWLKVDLEKIKKVKFATKIKKKGCLG